VGTITKALLGAALICLATATSAFAAGQVKDPCSVGAIGTPPNAYPDPSVPWLDLCNTDIAGFAGAGSARGIQVTFHVAGDTALRAGSAAYLAMLDTGKCAFQIQYSDLGPDAAAGTTRVQGACNVTGQPCQFVPSDFNCWQTDSNSGEPFDLRGSSAATYAIAPGLTGSTVTVRFDPDKVAAGTVPAALLGDLTNSPTVYFADAASSARVGAAAANGEAVYDPVDWAFGDGKPFSLG
jgi:hypothetical protein